MSPRDLSTGPVQLPTFRSFYIVAEYVLEIEFRKPVPGCVVHGSHRTVSMKQNYFKVFGFMCPKDPLFLNALFSFVNLACRSRAVACNVQNTHCFLNFDMYGQNITASLSCSHFRDIGTLVFSKQAVLCFFHYLKNCFSFIIKFEHCVHGWSQQSLDTYCPLKSVSYLKILLSIHRL